MKRTILLMAAGLMLVSGVFAQSAATPAAQVDTKATQQVGAPDPQLIGVDKAQQELKEISISKFEDDGFWAGSMMSDYGYISLRRFRYRATAIAKT